MKSKWLLVLITLFMLFSPVNDTILSSTGVTIEDTDFQKSPLFEKSISDFLNSDNTLTHLKTVDAQEIKARILFDEAHTSGFAADFAPGPISALGGFLNTLERL